MRYRDMHGGFFELNPFPGCNQIVVSNHSWLPPEERGKGRGSEIHKQRLSLIQGLGYDYAICTVRSDNVAQMAILDKNGWSFLDEFVNRETGHVVRIYGRRVRREDTATS